MNWREFNIEVSLKIFFNDRQSDIRKVIEELFQQWRVLIQQSEDTGVLLWCSDGSEILEYSGDFSREFQWAKWLGVANPPKQTELLAPSERYPYLYPREYRRSPRTYTYGQLKEIIALFKQIFREMYHRELRVGTAFDPGMEFSVSRFKYQTHHECCLGHNGRFVCCYLPLHGDHECYAGYPEGIPEGCSFGTFFGRQVQCYLSDMGLDFIWFSNGFGFGTEAWGACGAVFDGICFHVEKAAGSMEDNLKFWRDFRRECPDFPVKVRGTNFSAGLEVSTDGAPLREIYHQFGNIDLPPNSPSASLDGDYAMAVVSYLSHIAGVRPGQDFTFRFYLHDTWFKASAWRDYYERSPYDILLPMSLACMDAAGRIRNAGQLNIFTVDTGDGTMPDLPVWEVTAAISSAAENRSDAPGPFVWIYPEKEYHDLAAAGRKLEEIYFGDSLVRGAVNQGFPLNTVISSENFIRAYHESPGCFSGCILLFASIYTENGELLDCIAGHLEGGGRAICYGPARGGNIEAFLGLREVPALEGEFAVSFSDKKVLHDPLLSGGGLDRENADPENNRVLAEYKQGDCRRPAMILRQKKEWMDGKLIWIRGTNSFTMKKNAYASNPLDRNSYAYPEQLFIEAMIQLGWYFDMEICDWPGARETIGLERLPPVMTWRRCRNGFWLSGYGRDTMSRLRLRLPDGAPLLCGVTGILEDGKICFSTTKALDLECRVFVVRQQAPARVRCLSSLAGFPEIRRRIYVQGLNHADVLFRPEPGTRDVVRFHDGNGFNAPLERPDDFEVERGTDRYGDYCLVKDVQYELHIAIPGVEGGTEYAD